MGNKQDLVRVRVGARVTTLGAVGIWVQLGVDTGGVLTRSAATFASANVAVSPVAGAVVGEVAGDGLFDGFCVDDLEEGQLISELSV